MIPINQNAPVVTIKSIIIEAKPEKIWGILTDIGNWPRWNKNIDLSKIDGPLQPNAIFKWKSAGMMITSRLHTVAPFYSFGWTGKVFGAFAIHNWMIKAIENASEVTTSESVDGLLIKLLKKRMQKATDTTLENWLIFLKNECERA